MKLLYLLFCLLPISSWGRIGETPEQCAKRYGAPKEAPEGGSRLDFEKGNFHIRIVFFEGKAAALLFVKSTTKGLISDTESTALLEANRGLSKWIKKEEDSLGTLYEVWASEDQKLHAVRSGSSLEIKTAEQINREEEEEKAAEKKALEGF